MKKFLIFLLVLIVAILIAIPILLWPTNAIRLKEDVLSEDISYISMIDVLDASVDWKGSSVSISVPAEIEASELNHLLLENFSFSSMQVDGSNITIENQKIMLTVQISKNGNFATQLNMSLIPAVQDGQLYLLVDQCRWGRIPIPKSILAKYVPSTYYNQNMDAFVVAVPEQYHVTVDNVAESDGKLLLTISSGELTLSSLGSLWSKLLGQ